MTKNEFEHLKPGQMVQNKKDNKWAFIVQQNFGTRVTATRTIEINNPEDWDVVTEVKHKEEEKGEVVKFLETMHDGGFLEAARKLGEKFKGQNWFTVVGTGFIKNELTLYVYTSLKKYPKELVEFEGYPVVYKYLGKILPAG